MKTPECLHGMHKACAHHDDLACACACHVLTAENRQNLDDDVIDRLVTGRIEDDDPQIVSRVDARLDRMLRGVYGTEED